MGKGYGKKETLSRRKIGPKAGTQERLPKKKRDGKLAGSG
jgi:hypothetical protein